MKGKQISKLYDDWHYIIQDYVEISKQELCIFNQIDSTGEYRKLRKHLKDDKFFQSLISVAKIIDKTAQSIKMQEGVYDAIL